MNKIINYIKKIYSNYRYNKEQQIQQQYLLQQQQYLEMIHLKLQYELGRILTHIQIGTKVCTINSYRDLLPVGYYSNNNVFVYRFEIAKNDANDRISIPILNRFKDKINALIYNSRKLLFNEYRCLDVLNQYELLQQYPLMFNGFRVVAVTDELNDIIIHVVLL